MQLPSGDSEFQQPKETEIEERQKGNKESLFKVEPHGGNRFKLNMRCEVLIQ